MLHFPAFSIYNYLLTTCYWFVLVLNIVFPLVTSPKGVGCVASRAPKSVDAASAVSPRCSYAPSGDAASAAYPRSQRSSPFLLSWACKYEKCMLWRCSCAPCVDAASTVPWCFAVCEVLLVHHAISCYVGVVVFSSVYIAEVKDCCKFLVLYLCLPIYKPVFIYGCWLEGSPCLCTRSAASCCCMGRLTDLKNYVCYKIICYDTRPCLRKAINNNFPANKRLTFQV